MLSDWKPVNMFFHKTFYLLRSIFFCSVLLDLNGESHFKIPAVISERSKGQLKLSKFGTAVFLFSSSSHWCWDFNAASDTMWLSNMWVFFFFQTWRPAVKYLLICYRPVASDVGSDGRLHQANVFSELKHKITLIINQPLQTFFCLKSVWSLMGVDIRGMMLGSLIPPKIHCCCDYKSSWIFGCAYYCDRA